MAAMSRFWGGACGGRGGSCVSSVGSFLLLGCIDVVLDYIPHLEMG